MAKKTDANSKGGKSTPAASNLKKPRNSNGKASCNAESTRFSSEKNVELRILSKTLKTTTKKKSQKKESTSSTGPKKRP